MPASAPRLIRAMACLSGLALLSACASHGPSATVALSGAQEAAIYKSHARSSYAPPGPPGDPWGPYVTEAAGRFDVPDVWIREVMQVESHGYQFRADGALTTSPVGAMGLMQLMPATYDEVRARYDLGDDAYDPHNNILAGAAYLREMYDVFGNPGFLAAYNAGPARLEDYLTNRRPLPDETRRYVAMIGYRIAGTAPQSRSPAEQLASNQLPIDIPGGLRWVPRHSYALAARGRRRHEPHTAYASNERRAGHHPLALQLPVEVAEAPEPRAAAWTRVTASHRGLHFISPAMASETMAHGGTNWAVQVGAYGSANQAHAAAGAARGAAGSARPVVAAVGRGHATLYRARLGGMTHSAAVHACARLSHGCMIVSPAAR